MSGSDPAEAVARALSFLKAAQQPDGGFLNQFQYADQDPILVANVFPAALIAHCLSFSPAGRSVTERALDFLAAEASKEGVWSHFSSSQLDQEFLPPDVDDTACASAALRQGCRPVPDNEALMLANRDRRGLFYTWFTFRPRWSGLAHWRLVWPQHRHLATLWPLFTRTTSSIYNVDAAVNANVLFYLGERPETAAIRPYLLKILEEGSEETCDTWYPSKYQIWYFVARALQGDPAAERLLRAALDRVSPVTPLEAALAQCTRFYVGLPPSGALRDLLISTQTPSGAWGVECVYHGLNCWWGSEAMTTAFAVEALSRDQAALQGDLGKAQISRCESGAGPR